MRDESASFRKRFFIALLLSLLVHVLCMIYAAYSVVHYEMPMRPLVLTMSPATEHAPPAQAAEQPAPPPSPEPQSLVDAMQPAHEPVKPTDLIAERDSNAGDMQPSDEAGANDAPNVDIVGEFDDVGSAPGVQAQARVEQKGKRSEGKKAAAEQKMTPEHLEKPAPESAEPAGEDASAADRAQDAVPLPAGDGPGAPSRGRVDGNVKNLGFLGFEAMKSEVAPYLKEVRRRVERRWHAALQMRYSGTTPTRAVVECAIAPDGRLLEAVIVEAGDSPTYAALCREAIRSAGPFPAFPFQVPEMYRSKNLEIRWTFGFLE